ncbi:MAG: VWA domain-containing protein, partial [Planctomycetota bacterium]
MPSRLAQEELTMNARIVGMYSALSLILSAAVSWSTARPLLAEQVVVIVLDDSGSMDETMRTERGRVRKIDAAKEALRDVVVKLPEDTQVGVLALNTEVDGSPWIAPVGPVSRTALLRQLDRVDANGGTPLGQAMKEAADALLQLREKQVYGLYRLLIVTDGEANDQHLVDGYLPDILGRGIVVDVIGVDMRGDHSLAT